MDETGDTHHSEILLYYSLISIGIFYLSHPKLRQIPDSMDTEILD